MTQTSTIIAIFRHLFAKYGLPQQIMLDNGPQFISSEFAQFMKLKFNGI